MVAEASFSSQKTSKIKTYDLKKNIYRVIPGQPSSNVLQLFVTITFQILWTSEVRHGLWNHQHADCFFNKLNLTNGLLELTTKKTPKRRITFAQWW